MTTTATIAKPITRQKVAVAAAREKHAQSGTDKKSLVQAKGEKTRTADALSSIIATGTRTSALTIQPKIKIGPPNDKYEQEADQVADQVMSMPDNAVQRKCAACEEEDNQKSIQPKPFAASISPLVQCEEDQEELQAKFETALSPWINRQQEGEEEQEESVQTKPLIQRMEEEEEVQGKIQPEEDEEVQPKIQRQEEEQEDPIQTKSNSAPSYTTDDLSNQLQTSKGGGSPLPDNTRSFMESRIGADFSSVRVHTGEQATAMSNQIGAQAFTHGSDIYFNENKYNPESSQGKHLLAHELTHTVQQGAAVRTKPLSISPVAGSKIQRFSFSSIMEKVANYIPGYTLIKVILGRSPITGKAVPRTGINILRGVMGLIPVFGEMWFQQLQQANTAAKAGQWIDKEIDKLNISWSGIKALFRLAWKRMSIWKGISGNIRVVKEVFSPTWFRIKRFVANVGHKMKELIVEGIFSLAGKFGKQAMTFLKSAGKLLGKIWKDPLKFAKTLLNAVGQGFKKFYASIGKHLKGALIGFIFGTLAGSGLQIPKKFNLGSMVFVVLQLLGLTWEGIRKILVAKLGEPRVTKLEKVFEFVKILATQGIKGLIKTLLQKGKDIVMGLIDSIKNWVITKVVGAAVLQLVSLFNPAGALFAVLKLVYKLVELLINNIDRIIMIFKAMHSVVKLAAAGQGKKASEWVTKTLVTFLPVAIGFLAGYVGLGNIGTFIKNTVQAIGKKVKAVIMGIINWIVKKAKKLFKSGKAAVKKAVKKLLNFRKKFKSKQGKEHAIFFNKGRKLMVASDTKSVTKHLRQVKHKLQKKPDNVLLGLVGDAERVHGELEVITRDDVRTEKERNIILSKIEELSILLLEIGGLDPIDIPDQAIWEYGHSGSIYGSVKLLSTKTSKVVASDTIPQSIKLNPGWDLLQAELLTHPKHGYWVRMHLITRAVGGKNRKLNLIPAPNAVNKGSQVRSFESSLKKLVAQGEGDKPNVVWALVTANSYHPKSGIIDYPIEEYNNYYVNELEMKAGIHLFDGKAWKQDPNPKVYEKFNIPPPDFSKAGRILINLHGARSIAKVAGIQSGYGDYIAEERIFRNVRDMFDRLDRRITQKRTGAFENNMKAILTAIAEERLYFDVHDLLNPAMIEQRKSEARQLMNFVVVDEEVYFN